MEHRTKRDLSLMNLVAEFEKDTVDGNQKYLRERDCNQLINFYEEELQFDKALDVVDIALSHFEYRSEFFIAKSRILLRTGKVNDSLAYLDKAEEVAPFEIEVKVLKAKILALSGDTDQSAEILMELRKAVVMDSNLVDILICESFIREVDKDFSGMYEVLVEAVNLDPDNAESLERLLLSVELSRNYHNSVALHKRILDDNPYNYLAWYNLGHAFASLGEYRDAIIALEYSFIINENFENGYLDCADFCFQTKNYKKAYSCYDEANNTFGPDPELLVPMASCLIIMGNPVKAKDHLFEALTLDPYNDEIYFHLGNCYAQQSKWFKAINAYHKAISIEEGCEEYYMGLAKAYVAIENFEKSVYFFTRATKTGPEQSDSWRDFIIYLIRQGKLDDALKVLDEAEEYTFSADLLYCRGAIYIMQGEKQEGLEILEEALVEDFDQNAILFEIQPELHLDRELSSMIEYFSEEENPDY